jgi:hypothetical protein
MSCRIEKDVETFPARLMLGSSRTQGHHQVDCSVEVLYCEVEVELLGKFLVGPLGSPVVLDPLESESKA